MDFVLKHLLDFIVILIILWGIHSGTRRGFLRTIIVIAGLGAAFFSASFVSSTATDYIYIHAVKPSVIAAIEIKADQLKEEYNPSEKIQSLLSEQGITISDNQLQKLLGVLTAEDLENTDTSLLTNDDFRATLNNVFTEYCSKLTESLKGVLPDEIADNAEKYLNSEETSETDKSKILDENPLPFAELIEREIIRPIMLQVVNKVLFAVTFAVVMLIASVLSHIFGIVRKCSVTLKSADSFFGGLCGLIGSFIILAVFSLLCSIFISFTGGKNPLVNTDIIDNTYIFKYIYSGTYLLISMIIIPSVK